jgi:hypothetical protein
LSVQSGSGGATNASPDFSASAASAARKCRRNTWRWPAEYGKVERSTGEDRSSNGAHCPRVSVVMGCVIDIGEPAPSLFGLARASRLRE